MRDNFWVEVEDAYARAVQLPEEKREPFLRVTYEGRPEIRREVESLLRYKPAADRLSQSTVFARAARMFNEDDRDLIGSVVAGKYLVRQRLGASQMAEVYLADHLTLDEPFVLKRPAPTLRGDPDFRRRLLDEARHAVSLKHDNVARVHDIIESGDDVFLVMEFIEGRTLRAHLQALGRPLSAEEFYPIAVQCASALAAAHAKRIVHLDVKPENIMLTTAGQVKICDFGVARKLSSNTPGATTISEAKWTFAGTPGYMAPEVILSYQFDQRADQFSLGIVFYEMLTGRNPFLADTVYATTARVVKATPPPIRQSVPGIDPELERIVMRLLAKEPEDRFASAGELVQSLEAVRHAAVRPNLLDMLRETVSRSRQLRLLAAVLLLGVIALAPAVVYRDPLMRWVGTEPLPEKKILVVLPFRVVGEGRGQQFYSEGLSEILTGKLTQLTTIPGLQVVPPSAVYDARVDTAEKARAEFGATLVLQGTVQFADDQLRLSYDLVDPVDRRELRGGSKRFRATDLFSTQDIVIRDVVAMLELELSPPATQTLRAFGTSVLQAYFLYTEGHGALRNFHERENIDTAINLFTQATEQDPLYSEAYAALGQSYWRKFFVTKEKEWLDRAQTSCETAINNDQLLSAAHTCLGMVNKSKGEYELAAENFNRAIALEPTNDNAQRELGWTYEGWNRLDEAENTYLRAIEVRPHYWAGYMWLASFYMSRRHEYAKAIEYYHKALAASPGNGQAYYALGAAYINEGKYDEAISILQEAVRIRPYWETYYNLGMAYLRSRRYIEAVQHFETAAPLANDYRVSGSLARAYLLSGQQDRARQSFQLAIEHGEKLLNLNSRDADVHVLVGRYYAMLGKKPESLSHLTLALNASPNDLHYLLIAAVSHLQLGDGNTALNLMEQAIAHGATLVAVRAEPELDALEADPRFTALVSAIKPKS